METSLPIALGRDVQLALEFSHFINGVFGSCDHALALTSWHQHDQSRVPSLDEPCRLVSSVLRTPRTPARHDPLSPSAYRDRLRRRGRRDGSLLFRIELCRRALLYTPEVSCTLRNKVQSVAFTVA